MPCFSWIVFLSFGHRRRGYALRLFNFPSTAGLRKRRQKVGRAHLLEEEAPSWEERKRKSRQDLGKYRAARWGVEEQWAPRWLVEEEGARGWKGGGGAKVPCWECQSWEEAPGWGGRARSTLTTLAPWIYIEPLPLPSPPWRLIIFHSFHPGASFSSHILAPLPLLPLLPWPTIISPHLGDSSSSILHTLAPLPLPPLSPWRLFHFPDLGASSSSTLRGGANVGSGSGRGANVESGRGRLEGAKVGSGKGTRGAIGR
jgi:hypothetical protein